MRKKTIVLSLSCVLLASVIGIEGQDQHPILDQVANKVIQKYQTASCQQLWGGEIAACAADTRRSEGNTVSAQRSTDAHAVHQQSGRSCCQQDV
jgi:hypothetical protein